MGERDAGAGQLGRDAERLRPEPREDDAGVVDRWLSRRPASTPAASGPAVPAHPLGGPQPAFCDLEEHNALTAHQERQRLRTRGGGEQWLTRPTARSSCACTRPARWCCSLTTEADGKEAEYAQLVGRRARRPALDVKVVPADTDRFGDGHGFNTSPSAGTPAAISSATAKIRDKGRLLAGMALDAAARQPRVGQRRVVGRRRATRRSRTSRCTRTAPARCRPASRAGSTRRRSTATEDGPRGDLDVVEHLQACRTAPRTASCPSASGVTVARALTAPSSSTTRSKLERLRRAGERELARRRGSGRRRRPRPTWNGT